MGGYSLGWIIGGVLVVATGALLATYLSNNVASVRRVVQ